MRRTWVYIDGVAYEKGTEPYIGLHHIMPEIEPYQSQITGEMITSRAKHQEHLRRHGYQEIGNDKSLHKPYTGMPDAAPQQRKELLVAQVNAMTNDQFRAAGMKDLNRLRWQTNGIPDPLKEI